jgi:hypothetical protein
VHYETSEKKKSDGQETREWRESGKTRRSAAKKKNEKNAFFFYAKLASTL